MSTTILNATIADVPEILALYDANRGGLADWSDTYPNEDTIEFDLARDALFVMKNENGEILAAISIDEDEEVNKLDLWNKEIKPAGEVSRLCVRGDARGQGIARQMMQHTFNIMKGQGIKIVHILVRKGHYIALSSYAHLDFVQVGECYLFDKEFICMEKIL